MARPLNRKHPASVYRRRRLGVLLVLLLLAGGAWAAIAQPWKDGGPLSFLLPAAETAEPTPSATVPVTGTPSPSGTTSPSGTPTPTSSPTPTLGPCEASQLTVEALTDKQSYGAEEKPQFSIRLSNTGDTDCILDVGTDSQRFTVTSGQDVWWDSRHCQQKASEQLVTLAAGKTVQTTSPLVWDRTRSSKGSCEAKDRPRASGGGASYHLEVEIGGVASSTTRQFFLR